MLAVWALYYNVKRVQLEEAVIAPARQDVIELQQSQQELLAGPPRWIKVDVQGETVRRYVVPIERAMELVVQETNGGRR